MLEKLWGMTFCAVVIPIANFTVLRFWSPTGHHLVDFLFLVWDLFFYLGLIPVVIALAVGVILSQNPIRSLFCLIGVFIGSIFLLLSIRVEFLSMILLIVYIGAIAILFLFVIMLLNLKKVMPVWQQGFWSKLAAPVFFLFLTERGYAFLSSALYINSYYNSFTLSRNLNSGLAELNQINYFMRYGLSDASIFSDLFYGVHAFAFLATACILTVSMIGSIVLALSATELKK